MCQLTGVDIFFQNPAILTGFMPMPGHYLVEFRGIVCQNSYFQRQGLHLALDFGPLQLRQIQLMLKINDRCLSPAFVATSSRALVRLLRI